MAGRSVRDRITLELSPIGFRYPPHILKMEKHLAINSTSMSIVHASSRSRPRRNHLRGGHPLKGNLVPPRRGNRLLEPDRLGLLDRVLPAKVRQDHEDMHKLPVLRLEQALLQPVPPDQRVPCALVRRHELLDRRALAVHYGPGALETKVRAETRPHGRPADGLAVGDVEDGPVGAPVPVQGDVDLHLGQDVLERVAVGGAVALLRAREGARRAPAVDLAVRGTGIWRCPGRCSSRWCPGRSPRCCPGGSRRRSTSCPATVPGGRRAGRWVVHSGIQEGPS